MITACPSETKATQYIRRPQAAKSAYLAELGIHTLHSDIPAASNPSLETLHFELYLETPVSESLS
jgi:hypothetical protein